MKQYLRAVGLVVVVLLAGCGGGFGSGAGTAGPPSTTTVSADDPLADPPAGLSGEGITDSYALADAHADASTNVSFTVRHRHTLTAANGTRLVDSTSVQRVAADHRRWTTERTFDGTYARMFRTSVEDVEGWFNGTHAFYRMAGPNGTEYAVLPITGAVDPADRQTLLSYYLRAESATVSTANGSIELRLTVIPDDENTASMPAVNVTEQAVTVTMTATGRVERYRVEYAGRLANDPDVTVEGVDVVRYTSRGDTTVDRPDWLPAARNASAA